MGVLCHRPIQLFRIPSSSVCIPLLKIPHKFSIALSPSHLAPQTQFFVIQLFKTPWLDVLSLTHRFLRVSVKPEDSEGLLVAICPTYSPRPHKWSLTAVPVLGGASQANHTEKPLH